MIKVLIGYAFKWPENAFNIQKVSLKYQLIKKI